MPKPRTGALVKPGADGIWKGRITAEDGSRPLYSLGTCDRALAKRKLAQLARGDVPETTVCSDTVTVYSEGWIERRKTLGVAKAPYEEGILKNHVLGTIGRMLLVDVRTRHCQAIVDEAIRKGLSRETAVQVRGTMNRLFEQAWREELIEVNPVKRVHVPMTTEVKRERVILDDDEFSRFVACPAVDLEIRMLGACSRIIGGMRAGDLNQWDWRLVDRADFATCSILRSKKRRPQELIIPAEFRPLLRQWWERAGKPTSGPVFPARGGKNAGKFKKKKGAYAERLRKALIAAGIFRLPPVREARRVRVGREDRTREAVRLVPHPDDPLYVDTLTTRKVDFHSFRRAFSTALAESNVNAQRAMRLADHSSTRAHERYLMRTKRMQIIPPEIVPALPSAATELPKPKPPAPVPAPKATRTGSAATRARRRATSTSSAASSARTTSKTSTRATSTPGATSQRAPKVPKAGRARPGIVTARDDSKGRKSRTQPNHGAGEGIRTLDVHLGNLYHGSQRPRKHAGSWCQPRSITPPSHHYALLAPITPAEHRAPPLRIARASAGRYPSPNASTSA